jgi:hypothetical protein
MSILYEIRIIDHVTAGFGTIIVKTPDRSEPVFFTPEMPEEAVLKLKQEGRK